MKVTWAPAFQSAATVERMHCKRMARQYIARAENRWYEPHESWGSYETTSISRATDRSEVLACLLATQNGVLRWI